MRRRRRRAAFGPPAVTVVALVLGVFLWRTEVEPRLPPAFSGLQHTRGRLTAEADFSRPVYTLGRPTPDATVFAGDSRFQAGIDLDLLGEGDGTVPGLGDVALVTGPSGQLRELLRVVEAGDARRLVLGVSPLSVWAPPQPRLRAQLEEAWEPWTPVRVDDRLDRAFADRHRSLLRSIPTNLWVDSWWGTPRPAVSAELYRVPLAPRTRATRAEHLERLTDDLRRLVAEGWAVVCVRTPVSPEMLAVEREALPDDALRAAVEAAGVPFLDLSARHEFRTSDGSHLMVDDARRFGLELLLDLRDLPGFGAPTADGPR